MLESCRIEMSFVQLFFVVNGLYLMFDVLQEFGEILWNILSEKFPFVTDFWVHAIKNVKLKLGNLGDISCENKA